MTYMGVVGGIGRLVLVVGVLVVCLRPAEGEDKPDCAPPPELTCDPRRAWHCCEGWAVDIDHSAPSYSDSVLYEDTYNQVVAARERGRKTSKLLCAYWDFESDCTVQYGEPRCANGLVDTAAALGPAAVNDMTVALVGETSTAAKNLLIDGAIDKKFDVAAEVYNRLTTGTAKFLPSEIANPWAQVGAVTLDWGQANFEAARTVKRAQQALAGQCGEVGGAYWAGGKYGIPGADDPVAKLWMSTGTFGGHAATRLRAQRIESITASAQQISQARQRLPEVDHLTIGKRIAHVIVKQRRGNGRIIFGEHGPVDTGDTLTGSIPMSFVSYRAGGAHGGSASVARVSTSSVENDEGKLVTITAGDAAASEVIEVLVPANDRDADGLRDDRDQCPDRAGSKEFRGCPDTDRDGIEDRFDRCPDAAGPERDGGCPDTDGDRIVDKDDKCPHVRGPTRWSGCPDGDGDGIGDDTDQCPAQKGRTATNGCPDRDGDGVADNDDSCPTVKGRIDGCPDGDGDGIADHQDRCPRDSGPIAGCPDRDGDRVADGDDRCPSQAGVSWRHGCPEPRKPSDRDRDGIADADDACPDTAGVARHKGCPPPVVAANPPIPYWDDAAGMWGYKRDGVVVIQPRFSWAKAFSEGRAAVTTYGADGYGFIDESGTLVIPMIYTNGQMDWQQLKLPHQHMVFKDGKALVTGRDSTVDRYYIDKNGNRLP